MNRLNRILNSDPVATVMQILAYVFGSIPLRLILRTKVKSAGDLDQLKKGGLIVSNHISKFDPFLIVFSLPFRDYLKLLPIRYPTSDYMYNQFYPILTMLGCFSVGKTSAERMRSVFRIREYLSKGYTVMIFPEGTISDTAEIMDFKRGIDFFIKGTHTVLFVRLSGLGTSKKLTKEKGSQVTFSKVFSPPPDMSSDEMNGYLKNFGL